jgi:hypothetical protein
MFNQVHVFRPTHFSHKGAHAIVRFRKHRM